MLDHLMSEHLHALNSNVITQVAVKLKALFGIKYPPSRSLMTKALPLLHTACIHTVSKQTRALRYKHIDRFLLLIYQKFLRLITVSRKFPSKIELYHLI